MEPMLGLSHTFEHVYVIELVRSCVRSHVIGFWWAHIGPYGGSIGPMLGLCLAYVEQKIPSFHWAYVQTISTQT